MIPRVIAVDPGSRPRAILAASCRLQPAVIEASKDRGAFLPAPGRFPQGKGPFGHMDLAGGVESFTAEGGIMQYSFQEAGKEDFGIPYGRKRTWIPATKHWAVGARCVRKM